MYVVCVRVCGRFGWVVLCLDSDFQVKGFTFSFGDMFSFFSFFGHVTGKEEAVFWHANGIIPVENDVSSARRHVPRGLIFISSFFFSF